MDDDVVWIGVGNPAHYVFANPTSGATLSPTGEFRFAKAGEWATYPGRLGPWVATFDHPGRGESCPPAIILKLTGKLGPKTFVDRLREALPSDCKDREGLLELAQALEDAAEASKKVAA